MMLRCDKCGGRGFAVAPGSDEVRELFLLVPAVPMRCWCLVCWLAAHKAVAA